MTEQERFMKEAIRQAKKAEALEEVPIGCVIVTSSRRAQCHTQGQQKAGRLAFGGLYHVCDTGALSDVRGSSCAVQDR